jgi:peptidoglycan-N-acetylglucosamine deacetylase
MKSKIKLFICCMLLCLPLSSNSQNSDVRAWNHKKCAICLTYDDGLNVHLDKVIPQLDSMNFKGTFYIPGNSECLKNRLDDWRNTAKKGHELGNHTLFHACNGGKGREWVKPDYDLSKYTLQRIIDEVQLANTLLKAIDGKTKRTFAYTCGDARVENVYFMDKLKNDFISARGVKSEMLKISDVDLYNIGCYMINNQTGNELINLVRKSLETKTLLVFLFHGVGGEHNINVSLDAHRELLKFLKENEKDIWVAPFIEISEYIKDYNNKTNINR